MRDEKLVVLDATDMQDMALNLWIELHSEIETEKPHHIFECLMCGEPMYPSMDYTHAPECPYELVDRAVDKFISALTKARRELSKGE